MTGLDMSYKDESEGISCVYRPKSFVVRMVRSLEINSSIISS